MVDLKIEKVLWCYGIYPQIQFHEEFEHFRFNGNNFTYFGVSKIFTKINPHINAAVLYLT